MAGQRRQNYDEGEVVAYSHTTPERKESENQTYNCQRMAGERNQNYGSENQNYDCQRMAGEKNQNYGSENQNRFQQSIFWTRL